MNYDFTLKAKKPIELTNPLPIDIRDIWNSYNEALTFAQNSPTAYEGESINVKMNNGRIITYNLEKDLSGAGNYTLSAVGLPLAFRFVDALPSTDVEKLIYILNSNSVGYIENNSKWVPILYPKSESIDESNSSNLKLVSEDELVDYVCKKIKDITEGNDTKYVTNISYDKITGVFTVVKSESVSAIKLDGAVHDPTYDIDTRTFTFPIYGKENPLVINLGKDIFIDPTKANKYNEATGNIELYLNDGSVITIPAKSLIDVYTGQTTPTISLSVSDDNVIKANVKISSKSNNAIKLIPTTESKEAEEGIYVETPKDFTGDIDLMFTNSKAYTDAVKHELSESISATTQNYIKADAENLNKAKQYADGLIKDFTFITQNALNIVYSSNNNQTVFNMPPQVTYNPNSDKVELYINGCKQMEESFETTSASSITLKAPLSAGYRVEFKITRLDMSSPIET